MDGIPKKAPALVFGFVLGLCSIFASCKRSGSLTAYSCEPGTMFRIDGTSPLSYDPFDDTGKVVETPFEELQEPWTILRTFRVEKDRDIDESLDFRKFEPSKQASAIPMIPYRGALVFEDPAGARPVLVAVKADNQTIRISNARLKNSSTFILEFRDFDDLCYITNKPLAGKLLSLIALGNATQTEGDKPLN